MIDLDFILADLQHFSTTVLHDTLSEETLRWIYLILLEK